MPPKRIKNDNEAQPSKKCYNRFIIKRRSGRYYRGISNLHRLLREHKANTSRAHDYIRLTF